MASGFGLLADAEKQLAEVRRKLHVAKNHVHNLRVAVQTGSLGQIPPEQVKKMLDETAAALDDISLI